LPEDEENVKFKIIMSHTHTSMCTCSQDEAQHDEERTRTFRRHRAQCWRSPTHKTLCGQPFKRF